MGPLPTRWRKVGTTSNHHAPYVLGYNDLRDPSVSGFFPLLAKVGDGMMKMQIVKIGFGGKQ